MKRCIYCLNIAQRVAQQGGVRGQELENAVLFSRKSFWRDTCRSLGECWTITSQYTSLWKTAIQTIEGKHGACRHCTEGLLLSMCSSQQASWIP